MKFSEKIKSYETGKSSGNTTPTQKKPSFSEKIKNYNTIDEEFYNTFINDVDRFFSSAQSDYDNLAWGTASSVYDTKNSTWNDLGARANKVGRWLETQKGTMDEDKYSNLSQFLEELKSSGPSVVDVFKNASDMSSRFDTEEAYDVWRKTYDTEQAMATSEQGKKGIAIYNVVEAQKEKARLEEENREKSFWEQLRESGARMADASAGDYIGLAMSQMQEAYYLDDSYKKPNDDWSESQKNVFGYLYFEDIKAAENYAIRVNNEIKSGIKHKTLKDIGNSATSGFWAGLGHTVASLATSPLAYADLMSDIAEYNARGTITQKDYVTPFEYSQEVQESISNKLNEMSGTLDKDLLLIGGKGLGDLYSWGTSTAQSVGSAYTLGPVGMLVSYFGQGAASSIDDALSRGADEEQALVYGTVVGLIEGATEMIGGERLLNLGADDAAKALWRQYVDHFLAEGFEGGLSQVGANVAEDVLNRIYKTGKTSFDLLVEQGMSPAEAWKKIVEDVAFGAVSEGLSGAVGGGFRMGVQSVANRVDTGRTIIDKGGEELLRKLAYETSGEMVGKEGTKLSNLAEKTAKKNSAYNVGKLSERVGKAITSQNIADIKKALIQNGLAENDAKRVSEYLGNTKAITKEQMAEIEGNEKIKSVVEDLLNNKDSAINERTRKLLAARLGTKIEAENSGELSLRNDVDVTEKVSNNGSTTVDGKAVKIDKENPIAKVKYIDGERVVYLNTDQGTVEASKVKYASKDEALLYEAFADMNPAFANAVIKNYDESVPIQTYINGMREGMILYGMHNFTGNDVARNTYFAELSEADQAFALKLGKAYAKADAKSANADLQRAIKNAAEKAKASEGDVTPKEAQNKPKKSKVSFEEGAKAGKQHKKIIALAKHLARAMNINIVFYDAKTTRLESGKNANGFFDEDTDTIYLDLQNAKDDAKTIAFTLSHELVHFIKKWSPQKFNIFAEFLMEQYASHGVSSANLLKQKMVELKTTDADLAYEEMIADACETMLLDSNAVVKLMELRKSDLELFEKIKLHIYKILNDIREAYKSLGYQPTSDEAKALLGMKDVLEKFYSLFEEAAVDATKNYQSLGTEGYNELVAKSTEAGKERFVQRFERQAKKVVPGMSDADRYSVLKDAKIIAISDLKSKEQPLYSEIEKIPEKAKGQIEKLIKELADALEIINVPLSTAALDIEFQLSKNNGLRESLSQQLKYGGNFHDFARALINLRDILERAVLIDVHTEDRYKGTYREDPSFQAAYVLLSAFKTQEYIIPVKLEIKQKKGVNNALYVVVSMTKIKRISVMESAIKDTDVSTFPLSDTDSVYSLPHLVSKVNPQDRNFLKYLPDQMLNAWQQAAKSLALKEDKAKLDALSKKSDGVKKQLKKSSDKDYLDAVDRGDMETAQRMVDEAAKEAGYTERAYHGTTAQFTSFSKKKARYSGLYGRGFYFTKSKSHSSQYGNTMEVFLKYEHPLSPDNTTITKEQIRNFLSAVAENEDYSIENYGTTNIEQILSKITSRDAFAVIQDINSTAIGDFVAAAELFNTVNGTKFDAIVVPTETVIFNPVQIKSADTVTYDDNGNIILPSERFNAENPDIRYQRKKISNRTILANALETTAQNDIEKNKLAQYKEKIALIEAEEEKLADLNAQIKELSFATGKRDTQKIKNLREEAIKTTNRINTYDRMLLNLESTAALKGVLEREKQKAYKRAEEKGREALDAYREKMLKKQSDIITRYQESRKKQREKANARKEKTEVRNKIRKVVKKLDQLLNRGTKDRNVKEEAREFISQSLALADVIFSNEIKNEDIIRLNRESGSDNEKIAEYASLLDKIDELNEKKKVIAEGEVTDETMADIEAVEEEIAKADNRISTLNSKLVDFFEIERARLNKTTTDTLLDSLASEYHKLEQADSDYIRAAYDEYLYNRLVALKESLGGTIARDMDEYQLAEVYDAYKMIEHFIRTANETFKLGRSESISTIAERVIAELEAQKKSPKVLAGLDTISKFDWNNLKPVYAFERIGSNSLTALYNSVRAGEDTWAVDINEAKDFLDEQKKKHNYDSFDFDEQYNFVSSTGNEFSLTLGQTMSLYAYSKRGEKAKNHLRLGGFQFDGATEIKVKEGKLISITYQLKDATAYKISDELLDQIIGVLDRVKGARAFVDDMQKYLSDVMGAKGNEVSRALYGIDLSKEENYFPLRVSSDYLEKKREEAMGEVKIKNSGFTQATVPGANKPIVLSSFMDVWASHVNEMSMYHAFVLPLEDFYRVFNYGKPIEEDTDTTGVIAALRGAHRDSAVSYVDQLLKDLNGGARVDPTAGIVNKLTALFKKSAVFASASVVIQQPSSIARATALIDPKYFVGEKISQAKHKATWEEIKKYAPVAIIKEMGYFDTGMGQSTINWLKGDKTVKDKIDEFASWAPAYADEVSWIVMWNAVKRETLHAHPKLNPTSEDFLKIAGERFTEVITKTQVYDSVLSRSANMRSKDTGMKMVTAFMGEPTTSLNMLEDALVQAKRGNKKYAAKAVGSVVASMILNSILVSLVYATRDDDEDKSYSEKYIETLKKTLIDNINPLSLIPLVKDVISIVKGYSVERSDMAVITDLYNAFNNLDSKNRSAYRKVEDFAGAIAAIFGLPVKNIMRDARGMYNLVTGVMRDFEKLG